ncbi:DUF1801 domain-containing protein [Parabacteroides faecis]|uniref:DUF1801 domain-containing protein n=1 Tax=Parabacteroides faecis TaxID=1217282 RepID=UPI002164117F|nr:DUF1801 domain-containing protein [Parabacteroides faecis]MCS2892595.1 DUF1801 domain-containing protein [Parabacteroides faecis]UVQ48768.1 DUF1801 domain-containing protein [Parabacteroides faecis]
MKETDNFYLNLEEPNRSCMLALRNIILEQNDMVMETMKWGMPCFCYKKKMFCFLSFDRKMKEPYILIVEGRLIDHPMLEAGTRSRMKILRIDPNSDLPISMIVEVLNEALDLYRNGVIRMK